MKPAEGNCRVDPSSSHCYGGILVYNVSIPCTCIVHSRSPSPACPIRQSRGGTRGGTLERPSRADITTHKKPIRKVFVRKLSKF